MIETCKLCGKNGNTFSEGEIIVFSCFCDEETVYTHTSSHLMDYRSYLFKFPDSNVRYQIHHVMGKLPLMGINNDWKIRRYKTEDTVNYDFDKFEYDINSMKLKDFHDLCYKLEKIYVFS